MPISGVQQPMLQSAALIDGKLTASEDLPAVLKNRTDLGDGDGTVPKVSAIPLERSQELDNIFIAEQHGGLQNQAQVLDNPAQHIAYEPVQPIRNWSELR
jgi:hypothetical protein